MSLSDQTRKHTATHFNDHISNRSAFFIWVFLVLATLAVFLLYQSETQSPKTIMLVIISLAYLKGRAIVISFMSLKCCERAWRIAYEMWLVTVAIAIIAMVLIL